MITALRPLSTSELLDRTFHLYKKHFVVFFAIVAIPQLAVLFAEIFYSHATAGGDVGTKVLLSVPQSLLSFILMGISQAATVHAVSNAHLEHPVRVSGAFRAIASRIFRYAWIAFAISFLVGIGLILLVVPGIYWALAYSLVMPVSVVEGLGLKKSMSRSSDLTYHERDRVFVICALFAILNWVVGTIAQFALGLPLPYSSMHGPALVHATRDVLVAISSFVTESLVGPLLTIAMTLFYYDQRVRREGFDLELMMAALQPGSALSDTQPTAAAAAAPNS